ISLVVGDAPAAGDRKSMQPATVVHPISTALLKRVENALRKRSLPVAQPLLAPGAEERGCRAVLDAQSSLVAQEPGSGRPFQPLGCESREDITPMERRLSIAEGTPTDGHHSVSRLEPERLHA